MSSFRCEFCHTDIVCTYEGYVTECDHYRLTTRERKLRVLRRDLLKALEDAKGRES